MAILYVTEYAGLAVAQIGGNVPQIPQEPPLAEQAIAITASSTTTAPFNALTTLVRIETDAICGVTFGTAPTASVAAAGAGSGRMVAGQTEYRGIARGQGYKVAVIATT